MRQHLSTLTELLTSLEQELKTQSYWTEIEPDQAAFMSELPFFMDKMTGYEWLQWILIPKLTHLAENDQLCLNNFAIYPYFEEVLRKDERDQKLHKIIKMLDELMQQPKF